MLQSQTFQCCKTHMASLSHIPTFHSLYSSKLFSPPFAPLKLHHQKISACSVKKPRASRKVKSNAELCNDIREFLSVVGLPEDHVPSMKELSQHGRQDLAHIVRRRGYKVIGELLAAAARTSLNMSDIEDGLTGKHEAVHGSEDKSTGQNVKLKDLADVSLSSDAVMMENHINGKETDRRLDSNHESSIAPDTSFDSSFQEKVPNFTPNDTLDSFQDEKTMDLSDDVSSSSKAATTEHSISSTEVGAQMNSDDQSCISPEASFISSLQEKAAKFIQNGLLDTIEGTCFGITTERSSEDAKYSESQDALQPEYGSSSREPQDLVVCSADDAEMSSGNNMSSSQQVEDLIVGNTASRNGRLSTESFIIDDHNGDRDVETQKVEHQDDINRLKFMLHQKELELTQLKQEIEKEKLALSALQTKAEKEISKAQKLISEKDAELFAAEESLSGLKEVEIQYGGDGEIVEVSGSFNGWHHRIKMDPMQSSSVLDTAGPRKSRLWRTALWLYPGVYEIKFVVDGHWKIDPQRESVSSGSIHNNILRVDR